MLHGVFPYRAVRGKARCQSRHAFPHPLHPGRGNALFVAGIKRGHHLPLEQVVERVGFDGVPRGILAVLPAVSQGPPDLRRVGFRPPPIQLRQVYPSVGEHLHAARSTCLPGAPGRVDPDVHPLDQVLGQQHVVVAEKDRVRARLRLPDEMHPFPDEGLSSLVRRMRLARDDELYRALRIGQETKQSLRIVQQQVRSLVGREAACKAQCQRVGIK